MALPAVEIKNKLGYIWVVLPDSVTMESNLAIESSLVPRLSGKGDKVVFDFGHTNNIFSSGLGLIIRFRKQVIENGGNVCLVNVSRRLRELFATLNLDRVFQIYSTDVEFEISRDEFMTEKLGSHEFVFIAQIEKGIYRISLSGKMMSGSDLDACRSFMPDRTIKMYLIDLGGLEIIDSGGVAVFGSFLERITTSGGICHAFGATEIVKDLLQVLELDSQLKFHENEQQALAVIGKSG
jgi:anti-anti-sigma factor